MKIKIQCNECTNEVTINVVDGPIDNIQVPDGWSAKIVKMGDGSQFVCFFCPRDECSELA